LCLTLNRPKSLNSLNRALLAALTEAFTAAATDETVRAIMLTGAGRGFCAGADLTETAADAVDGVPDIGKNLRENYDPLVRAITQIEKPVLCAVNGVAAGAGANFAFACDIVVAKKSARFLQAFARIALVPDAGGTWHLPRLIGLAKTKGLMMLADEIEATEAERLGLIWQVFEDDDFESQAKALALRLAKGPTKTLGAIKTMLAASADNNLDQQLALEAEQQTIAGYSEDFREGVMAFLQKRDANFKGK